MAESNNPFLDTLNAQPAAVPAPREATPTAAANPFLETLDLGEDAAATRGKVSVRGAVTVNPDQYAEARRIGGSLGVPADVAARNLEEVKKQAAVREYDTLMKYSPVLARQLQSADFASMSHDDIVNLSDAEWLLSAQVHPNRAGGKIGGPGFRRHGTIGPSPEPSFLQRRRDDFMRGLSIARQGVTVLGSELGLYDNAQPELGVRLSQQQRSIDKFIPGESEARGKKEISEATTIADALGAAASNPQAVLSTAVESMGSSSLALGTTLLGAVAGPKGAATGAALGSFLTEYTAVLREVIAESGVSASDPMAYSGAFQNPELMSKAREKAVKRGIPIAAFDALTAGLAGRLLMGAKPNAVSIGSRVAGEGALQAGGGAAGEATAQFATGEYKPGDIVLEALAELPTGVVEAYGNIQRAKQSAEFKVQQAQDDAQALQQLATLAVASKLRERDPQSFEQFVNAAAEEGPVQEVFIDARVFAQAVGEALPEIAAASPAVAQQLDEAVRVGGDIVIPLGEYAANIAATDLNNALMPHLRTSAGAWSMEQVKTYEQSGAAEELRGQMEKELEKREFDDAFKESAATVERELLAQFKAANRFTDDVNKPKAAYAALIYKQIAARLGITPEEAYIRYPLQIAAEGVAQQNVMDQDGPRVTAQPDAIAPGVQLEMGLESYAGRTYHPVEVVQVNPKSVRVRFLDSNLKGQQGAERDIPAHALFVKKVTDNDAVANAKDSGYNADSTLKQGEPDGSGSDLDFTGAGAQPQELHATVGGGSAAPGWAGATSIRGKSGPLAVSRGQNRDLGPADFSLEALGHNTAHPTCGLGVYFTNSQAVAAKHGEVESYFLDIRNPKVIKADELPPFESVEQAYKFREQLRAQGHDGIIVSARHLGSGRMDIVAFDPDQVIIPAPPVAEVTFNQGAKDALIVQHNATGENLLHALRVGGLAVPSLAITKANDSITSFGEITLIGPRELANPRGYARPRVFGADIYSPRYPDISYKLGSAELDKLNAILKPYRQGEEREVYGSEVSNIRDLENIKAFERYAVSNFPGSYGRPDFKTAGEALLREIDADERIFLGFTYSGNRRYKPHTLENVVKILKKELRGGESSSNIYGVGQLRAKFTPQFKTITSIQNARDRIVTDEQFEAVKKEVDAEFWSLVEAVQPYYKHKTKSFQFANTVIALIEDSARIGLNAAAKEYSFNEIPEDVRQQIFEFVTRLRNMPSEYFEAKILRGVAINEFTAAVVPEGTKQEVLDALKRSGVDVATYNKGDEKDRKRVVADTAGRYGENVLFQEDKEPAPIFYSALEREIAAAKMNNAPAQAWKDYLKSLISKGAVKKDEIEWSGIEEWLDMQEGKVTKEAATAFLRDNGVRVTERMLEGAATFEASFGEWEDDVYEGRFKEEAEFYLDEAREEIAEREDIPVGEVDEKEAQQRAEEMAERAFYDDPDRQIFRSIEVEANGKTYKFTQTSGHGESDLFAPSNQGNELDQLGGDSIKQWSGRDQRHATDDAQVEYTLKQWLGKQLGISFDEEGAPFEDYTLPGGENYKVLLITLPQAGGAVETDELGGRSLATFRSSHFDEPNILAHVRMKDRTDADGKKVLFVEEFQSDWAQKGKKEGFEDKAQTVAFRARMEEKYGSNWVPKLTVEEMNEYQRSRGGPPPAPFVQKTEQWLALAMKRTIRYAAENGYDRVAWTTGEQQADRYSLSRTVGSIAWEVVGSKAPSKLVHISLLRGGGEVGLELAADGTVRGTNGPGNAQFIGKKLEDVIGKAAAEKILSSEKGSLQGEGLKIGGEGMLAFYDKIVPNVANDVLKKLGGGRVGAVQVAMPPQSAIDSRTSRRENVAQPGFEITDAMRERAMQGQPLFQGGSGNRGQISFADDITSRPSTLTLLKNADLSTFFHELGHFYLEVLTNIASQPNAPAEVVQDMQIALSWFKPGMTLEEWRGLSLAEKRPYHEQFARAHEAYLFKGKSPNPELNGLFARFRAWFLNVYKYLTSLNVELTPEVRGVFDRMLATNEQILAAEAQRNYEPLFKSAEQAGMTPEEWKAYNGLALDATQEAVNNLQTRGLRDMQWLQNARSRTLKRLQKDAEGKRKAIQAEVTAEVRETPVYAAQRFLRHGELPEADRNARERRVLDAIAGSPTKLSLPALKEMYGEDPAAPWRYLPVGKAGLAATDGVHPDLIAELFGFTSGDHLVRSILEAQPESAVIEGMTDQRMLERYGDLSSPEALERATSEALHTEARARFVATELRMLAKATGQKATMTKAAKNFAATIVSRKKVRDIKPARYEAAEARSARAAEKALLAKNLPEAAVEKRNQLVNHYAARSAYDALEYVDRSVKYLRRVGESETIDPEYREQIDALLERFELKTLTGKEIERRRSLTQWIASEREKGNEPVIDPEIENEANRKPYQEMTLEEFNGLVDAVKNIEHLGRLKHKLLTAQDERAFEARVAEAAASIEDNAKRKVPAKLERNSWTDKMEDGTAEFFAMHRKFSSMIREMDGYKDGGVMWELFSRPMNRAGAREAVLREQATMRLAELMKPVKGMKDKLYIPAISNSLSREGRIVVALNAGNQGNLQRLMDGERWSAAQVRAVVDTLTKPEMDFVQAVWDFIGEYKQQIGEQQRRLTGVEPQWVEATPVPTPHGIYRGGYFPVKYDSTRSTRALADEAGANIMDQWRGARGQAKARDSFTKERADKVVDRPIRKDLGVLTQHITEVTHRLAWQEFLNDAQRLLRAKPIDAAIREHYGHKTLEAMRNTIEDVAIGEVPAQNAFERGVNHLRMGTTIAFLGWRVTTSLLQPFGLTQSWVRVGPKWVARGMVDFLGDAARMENTAKRINEKSDFMRLRGKTMQREVSEIMNQVEGRDSAIQASYFYLIQKMQLVADIPTWLGAYHKAVDGGANEDTAVALADQAVLDAQGGGQLKDLAAIQRGGPLLKLFTNFYSFFSTTYQLTQEAVGKTEFSMTPKGALSMGRLAADLLLLYSVPAALGTLLKFALQGGDDEDELVRKLIADQLTYLFGTMVGLREVAGGIQTAAGLPGDYQGPASVRFFAEVARLGKQAAQGEIDEALLKALNNVAGILFHFPSGQINATADGLYSLSTGETENPGALLVGAR